MLKLRIFNSDKLNNEETFWEYYEQMPPERKRKIDKCMQSDDKKCSLAAGILIQEFLNENNYKGDCVDYKVNEKGKPYFDGICFNVSHSGRYAVCVFSDREAGCDIELLNVKNLRVAERYFTESEKAFIFGQGSEDSMNERFVRLWTLKESYLKYFGTGLSKPLSSFCIQNLSEESVTTNIYFESGEYEKTINLENTAKSTVGVVDDNCMSNCCFYEYKLPDACISVCVKC